MSEHKTARQWSRENQELRKRLAEAEESLRAVRRGEVDALVVPTERGRQVFTLQGAEHFYRVLIEEMNEGAVTLSCTGGVLYSNQRFADMVKAPLEQVVGVPIYSWVSAQDRQGVESLLRPDGGMARRREIKLRCADGNEVASCLSVSALRGGDGPACFCLVATDLTDQNRARTALEESERKYRQLHEAMIDGFVKFDLQGRVTEFNEAYRSMLGYEWGQLLNLADKDLTPEKWRAFEAGVVESQVLVRGHSDVYKKGYLRKDGTIIPVELRTYLARDRGGNPSGKWAVVRDITERMRVEDEVRLSKERLAAALTALREQATHDSLTGVFNRAAILEILQRELARCERDGSSRCVAIADVDRFKSTNDTYGHPVGDEVLRQIILRLRSQVRPYDSIGRYGGEEFLIVAPNCTPTHALTLAERLRTCVANEPFQTGAGMIPVTLSLGVVTGTGKLSPDALFALADEALYRAKHNGRNRVEVTVSDEPSVHPVAP
jgi:diguanylate cyclase (GGDEF)-like protein/PAS domain S-box-containing protein